jgi:large subunit ribosomal protein L25
MRRVELELKPRDLGEKQIKRNANQLRSEGWIPGVLYGQGDPVKVAVNLRAFREATHTKAGTNALFTLKIGKETALGVIKEIQRHIIKHNPIHVDFQRINVKEKLELNVPAHSIGESPGVKNSGGILEHIAREVRIRCLPDDIPAVIDVDVSHLEVGQSIKVKDLPTLKGVEYLTAPGTIIVNVVMPKIEEEVKPAAALEGAEIGAEPDVIAKGKKPEEGAEGTAPIGVAAVGPTPTAKGKEEKKK